MKKICLTLKYIFRNYVLGTVIFGCLTFAALKADIFPVRMYRVSGISMEPTLKDGQIGVAAKALSYSYGDIVTFYKSDGTLLIKRVVGLPGDKVEIKDGRAWINGVLEDSFPENESDGSSRSKMLQDNTYTLAENEYFMLGDNRCVSNDSRYFGPVTKDRITYRVILL